MIKKAFYIFYSWFKQKKRAVPKTALQKGLKCISTY